MRHPCRCGAHCRCPCCCPCCPPSLQVPHAVPPLPPVQAPAAALSAALGAAAVPAHLRGHARCVLHPSLSVPAKCACGWVHSSPKWIARRAFPPGSCQPVSRLPRPAAAQPYPPLLAAGQAHAFSVAADVVRLLLSAFRSVPEPLIAATPDGEPPRSPACHQRATGILGAAGMPRATCACYGLASKLCWCAADGAACCQPLNKAPAACYVGHVCLQMMWSAASRCRPSCWRCSAGFCQVTCCAGWRSRCCLLLLHTCYLGLALLLRVAGSAATHTHTSRVLCSAPSSCGCSIVWDCGEAAPGRRYRQYLCHSATADAAQVLGRAA
jgi:hypothetical protein